MADEISAPAKGSGAWGQAITAVVLVGGLGAGLWVVQHTSSAKDGARPAATCPKGHVVKAPGHVSGAQLCSVLNRPDLAELLGVPGEVATGSGTGGDSTAPADGEKSVTPSAQMEFPTYTVALSADYDSLPVAKAAVLLGSSVRRQTVLGRPAAFYSNRTMQISFRSGGDGKGAQSAPGALARTLFVSQDAKDSGDSFELSLWRADGQVPDDELLLRLAQEILPTIPGWTPIA